MERKYLLALSKARYHRELLYNIFVYTHLH
jgi:hypothetical protein